MRLTEPFNNGLVTARDPVLLREGELQRAANTVYHPNDPGLHAAPAETQAASGLGASATGLVHCAFDFIQATCDITRAGGTVSVTAIVINSVTTVSGSAEITAPATNNFVGILKGATVTGTGIQASTVVDSVDSPTKITLSLLATANGTPNLTFTNAKFANVSVGATVAGPGIPNGATASAISADGTSLTLTAGFEAQFTGTSRLTVKADDLVIAQANGTYKKAKPGTAGTSLTFSTIESLVTEGDDLDQVHYNNLHVLLNGKHPNRVLTADGITRPHGLAPVTASCNPVITTGVWALKDGVGFYGYWTTEYDANNDIESDFNLGVDNENKPLKPPTVQITTVNSQAVQITRPPRANPTATHWRVYRSIKYTSTTAKSAAKENQYPNGWLIAQIELRDDNQQQTFVDGGGVSVTASVNAGSAVSGTGASGLAWANLSEATGAIDNGGATDDTNSATLTWASGSAATNSGISLTLGTFSVPSVTAPITGIAVTVTGRKTGNGALVVRASTITDGVAGFEFPLIITPSGQLNNGKVVAYTTSNASYTLGGASDLWGRKWDVSDFANGKFVIRCYGSVTQSGDSVTIDAVSVVVSYGESQDTTTGAFLSNITDPYPGITVSPYGFTISAGRGGQPPKATTGDIFQDSLLVNDVNDSSIARYSFPSRIDLFPAPYFLNFDTKEQDELTLIRTVGNVAVVGLKHQIYRANYLPRDTDAEFERGRAVELVESSHGIAGRKAGVVFTLPGFGQALAYANNYGVFMTDGYRVRPLTTDLDWWATVDLTRLNQCKFINNAELQVLEFYYVPVDAAITAYQTKQLYFHYHPSHLKGDPRVPELKVTGPRDTSMRSGVSASFADGTRKVYIGTPSGTVNYINRLQGVLDTIDVQTRSLVPANHGNEWRSNEVMMMFTLRDYLAVSPGTFSITADVSKTGVADRTSAAKTITIPTFVGSGSTNPKSRRMAKTVIPEVGQGISYRIQPTVTGTGRASLEYLIIDAEGLGLENPT